MFDAINTVVGAISGVLYQPWCVPLILLAGGIILALVGLGIFLDHQFGITLETLLQGIKGWFSGI